MEVKSIEAVGKTIEDAVARGLEALNVTRDEVEVVVLDPGSQAGDARPHDARVQLIVKERPGAAAPRPDDELAAQHAEQALQELLDKMRIKAEIVSRWDVSQAPGEEPELRFILDVCGEDLSTLIGRQSETVEALQYVTRLILARETQHRFNLVVDVQGYKARREQRLQQLAQRMAERVVATRKPVALEPMPAYERRIVHMALHDHPTVTTQSVGRGNRRKVTIIPRSHAR